MGAARSRNRSREISITDNSAPENSASRAKSPLKETKEVETGFPHNYEAIIKNSDSEVESNISLDKLYERLHAGVYLNNKKEKYYVEKKSQKNGFMLFARSLLITWWENNNYWMWSSVPESPSSDVFVEVAELLNVCWLEVHRKFDISKLSPGTTYEVVYVIMLRNPAYGWEVPTNLRLTLPDGSKQERKENLGEKQRGSWIDILAGEFTTPTQNCHGEIEFSMYEYGGHWKRGLVVKGVLIRPKS